MASGCVAGLFLFVTCLMMLSPFIWTAMSVTKPTDVAFSNPPVFFYQPTLQAFIDLWETTYFAQYLVNTLIVAMITTVLGLVIGIPAAYALSRMPGYISAVLLVLALIFRALPRFAVVLPMYEVSQRLGIYDTTYALAIALVAINQPFSIWLLRNFFAEIPKDLDEAAMIDGCTRVSMLRKVMIPLDGPGHSDRRDLPVPVRLPGVPDRGDPDRHRQQDGSGVHHHPVGADAADAPAGRRGRHLLTLPVIGIAFIAQKYLVAGLASGAVKG